MGRTNVGKIYVYCINYYFISLFSIFIHVRTLVSVEQPLKNHIPSHDTRTLQWNVLLVEINRLMTNFLINALIWLCALNAVQISIERLYFILCEHLSKWLIVNILFPLSLKHYTLLGLHLAITITSLRAKA